jgi:basic membrane protein A
VAGLQTDSNILGYVAPHPVPAVFQDVNAFTLGAQSVNPDVEVRVVWTNSWHDPATEREAAMSVIDVGADVVAHHQDSPAVPKAAAERGVYSFGYHWRHERQAPESVLMSTYWDWPEIYVPIARSVMEGTWEPQMYVGDMEDGLIQVTDLSDIAKSGIQEPYREAREKLENGTLEPLSGPIRNQDGELVVEAG